ncbi:hypothetical protein [Mesoterricola silvestris]|uniref:Uncharacterized protein n=1 Tax=Mesoterricola silvestris TaxID=2927979 RepID=A0AA48GJS6_9BACT|nr:hypothetical protein [Mesoterricola silvestris]BDU74306.1 hypothetical protein METEAL_34800 [Mesoterricola silvestris]
MIPCTHLRAALALACALGAASPALEAVDCHLTNTSSQAVRIFSPVGESDGPLQVRDSSDHPEGPFRRMPEEGVLLVSGAGLQFRVEDADLPVNGHFVRLTIQEEEGDTGPGLILHRVLPGSGGPSVNLLPIRNGNRAPRLSRDREGVDGAPLFHFDGLIDLAPARSRRPRKPRAPAVTQFLPQMRPAPVRDNYLIPAPEAGEAPPRTPEPAPAAGCACVIL